MDRFAHLQWPFFDPPHCGPSARRWTPGRRQNLGYAHDDDADAVCRRLVKELGAAGYLRHCVNETPDVRSIALMREVLAYHAGLADFAFAMQGLGSGSIVLAGNPAQKQRYLPRAAAGEAIAAFALSEPERRVGRAGARRRSARRSGADWVLDGEPRPGSPTAASPISTSFSPRPTKASAPSSWMRPRWTPRAHRHRRAASDGDVVAAAGREGAAPRRAGPGLQAGDAEPRHLSHHGCCGGARLRAARARRGARARARSAGCSASASPTCR